MSPMAGWGIAFADLDNDGWKDIAAARSDLVVTTLFLDCTSAELERRYQTTRDATTRTRYQNELILHVFSSPRACRALSPSASRCRRRFGGRGDHGLRAAGRPRPGARPPGRARRGPAGVHRVHHHQQGLRFRHEGGDARPRPAARRQPLPARSDLHRRPDQHLPEPRER